MISHRYRCIYVKVPKCGSTALTDWFIDQGRGRHSYRPWWQGGLLPERMQSVTQLMNLYPDYATFTFLRDPHERFVSLYRHALRNAADARGVFPAEYGTLAEYAELCRELLNDLGSLWGADLRGFFRDHGEREYGPRRIPLSLLRFEIGHIRPQTEFLPDCNPLRLFGVARADAAPLSFIGRVERMDEDFRRLGAMLGMPPASLPVRNASGSGTGAERARSYRRCYDAATRRLVEDIYAADFTFLDRDFEAGAGPVRRAAPPRTARRLCGRLAHTLWSSQIRFEQRIRARAPLRRLLRPLRRLRDLPR